MRVDVTTFDLPTLLLLTGGCLVLFVHAKRKLESNIPLIFFAGVLAYVLLYPGRIPAFVAYSGSACALLLRFEFMNELLTRSCRLLQYAIIGAILYTGTLSLLAR